MSGILVACCSCAGVGIECPACSSRVDKCMLKRRLFNTLVQGIQSIHVKHILFNNN